MTNKPNNAFPAIFHGGHDGMTLRQWYAGQALAALITTHLRDPANYFDSNGRSIAAIEAFQFADAMIAEGEKS